MVYLFSLMCHSLCIDMVLCTGRGILGICLVTKPSILELVGVNQDSERLFFSRNGEVFLGGLPLLYLPHLIHPHNQFGGSQGYHWTMRSLLENSPEGSSSLDIDYH